MIDYPLFIKIGRDNRPIARDDNGKIILFSNSNNPKEGDIILPLKIEDRGNYYFCQKWCKVQLPCIIGRDVFLNEYNFEISLTDDDFLNLIKLKEITVTTEITEEGIKLIFRDRNGFISEVLEDVGDWKYIQEQVGIVFTEEQKQEIKEVLEKPRVACRSDNGYDTVICRDLKELKKRLEENRDYRNLIIREFCNRDYSEIIVEVVETDNGLHYKEIITCSDDFYNRNKEIIEVFTEYLEKKGIHKKQDLHEKVEQLLQKVDKEKIKQRIQELQEEMRRLIKKTKEEEITVIKEKEVIVREFFGYRNEREEVMVKKTEITAKIGERTVAVYKERDWQEEARRKVITEIRKEYTKSILKLKFLFEGAASILASYRDNYEFLSEEEIFNCIKQDVLSIK